MGDSTPRTASAAPPTTPQPLRVGSLLYGYCGGVFGRDTAWIKRVEALGADWVVARALVGTWRSQPEFANGPHVLADLLDATFVAPGSGLAEQIQDELAWLGTASSG
jgi:hypothetical protein